MDHDDDGETSYSTFVDDVAFEPTYLQALLTAAGRNVATIVKSNTMLISSFTWLWMQSINQSINLLKAKGPYGHLYRSTMQYELYIK